MVESKEIIISYYCEGYNDIKVRNEFVVEFLGELIGELIVDKDRVCRSVFRRKSLLRVIED